MSSVRPCGEAGGKPTISAYCSARGGGSLFLIPGYTLQSDALSFHIFSGRDLSNGKSLMTNPQSYRVHAVSIICTEHKRYKKAVT